MPYHNDFKARAGGGRRLSILAVLILVIFLAAGGLLAANYKHFGNLIKVVSLVRTQYLYPVSTTSLVDGAIKGMVNALDDPYSVYLEPDTFSQLKEQITGTFGGLGILVGLKDQNLTVVRAYEGTPAARAGMQAGDVITGIDHQDVRGIDLETAVGLMKGPVGSNISLTVDRPGVPEPLQFTLTRQEISVPTVEGKVLPDTAVGYMVITQFTEQTEREAAKVLADLRNHRVQGLILDLRDNPGGELTAAVNVAKNFIPRGPIVHIDYPTGQDQTFSSDGRTVQLPLVVLINGASASAAEILAGAVKDTGAGILVGTKTFGKGIVQTVFPLDNDAGLKLTTARYLTPNKNDIHEKGIEPDVQVAETGMHDTQLNRALEIMNQKIAG